MSQIFIICVAFVFKLISSVTAIQPDLISGQSHRQLAKRRSQAQTARLSTPQWTDPPISSIHMSRPLTAAHPNVLIYFNCLPLYYLKLPIKISAK
jgi:hypothetical protein